MTDFIQITHWQERRVEAGHLPFPWVVVGREIKMKIKKVNIPNIITKNQNYS
jgi:hypothetical protein